MKLSFRSLVCLCLAVCGILCSGILLGGRISAEAKDQQVSVAFSQDDLALLAQESGLAVETWREALQQAGISHWIGQEPASFLLPGEVVGAATQVPLALVENHDRTSVLLPEGVDLETYDGPMVKTLYLYEDYANRATEGDAQEIENLLFRGVVDRGMRLLLLTPFQTEAGDYILDPGVYVTCLEDLGARLEARGLTLGETFSCLETEPASPLLLLGAGLVPVLLGGWLVCRWSKLQGRGWILVVVAMVALAALSQVQPDWMQKGLMLLSAVVFPCVAAWWIAQFARQVPSRLSRHWLAWDGILTMGLVLGWSLLGGLHVAALMASRSYLMGAQIFSGVKVALLLPIVFAALWRPGGEAGCPFCWRCSCSAGFAASSCCGRGIGRGAFPAWRPPCATGWRRPFMPAPAPRSSSWRRPACRCSCGPAGGRCCSSSSSVALGCVWSAFPWSTPSATGWRRWGCP